MIITICGSYKYKDKMIDIYKQLTEMGHIVLLPAIDCMEHDEEWYLELHYTKIEMSDAIYVNDPKKYVGISTSKEINYAGCHDKVIYRYSNHDLGVV